MAALPGGAVGAEAERPEVQQFSRQLAEQADAYLLRCAKVNAVATERDRKQLEARIGADLLQDRTAFRRVKIKPHAVKERPSYPAALPRHCPAARAMCARPASPCHARDGSTQCAL